MWDDMSSLYAQERWRTAPQPCGQLIPWYMRIHQRKANANNRIHANRALRHIQCIHKPAAQLHQEPRTCYHGNNRWNCLQIRPAMSLEHISVATSLPANLGISNLLTMPLIETRNGTASSHMELFTELTTKSYEIFSCLTMNPASTAVRSYLLNS